MKKILLSLALFLLTSPAWATFVHIQTTATSTSGNPLAGYQVTVIDMDDNSVGAIYSDGSGTEMDNPFTSGDAGEIDFWTNEDSTWKIIVARSTAPGGVYATYFVTTSGAGQTSPQSSCDVGEVAVGQAADGTLVCTADPTLTTLTVEDLTITGELTGGASEPTRTVTVAADGTADYTSIKTALDAVALETRSASARWVVEVHPGSYTESAFTIPTFTSLVGKVPHTLPFAAFGFGVTVINLSHTTGTGITCLGDMANLDIVHTGTLAGTTTIVEGTTSECHMQNVEIESGSSAATQALYLIRQTGNGNLYCSGCMLVTYGVATNTHFVSMSDNAAGSMRFYNSVIDGNGGAAAALVENLDDSDVHQRIELFNSFLGRASRAGGGADPTVAHIIAQGTVIVRNTVYDSNKVSGAASAFTNLNLGNTTTFAQLRVPFIFGDIMDINIDGSLSLIADDLNLDSPNINMGSGASANLYYYGALQAGNNNTSNLIPPFRTPASAAAACTQGSFVFDANFAYFCVATNTWKRVAIATW